MDESSPCEPDADERGHQLAESDAVRRFEDVQVLEDIGNRHQSKGSGKSQTCGVKHGWRLSVCSVTMQVGRMGCFPAYGGNDNSRNVSCSKPSLHCRKRPWEGAL